MRSNPAKTFVMLTLVCLFILSETDRILAVPDILATGIVLTVTRGDDRNAVCLPGDCSLREAVQVANSSPTNDVINFGPGVTTITLNSEHPILGTLSIIDNGTLTISGTNGVTIHGNYWSAVFAENNATVTISGLNVTGGSGTGILANGGSLTLDHVSVYGNYGENDDLQAGGGLFFFGGGSHRIINSAISNNVAAQCGGIFNEDTNLTIVNSIIAFNRADGRFAGSGGGFCNFGSATLRNVTITRNSATNGAGEASTGGGIYGGGTLDLGNSIVAGNFADSNDDGTDIACFGCFNTTSAGGNLISNAVGYSPTNLVYHLTDIRGADPRLSDGSNGQEFSLPLQGSPTIDRGLNNLVSPLALDFDLRGTGFPRIRDGNGDGVATVDIGAFERDPSIDNKTLFDYDGDGQSDFSVWRPGDGSWYLALSESGTMQVQQWGLPGDKIVPADFDGDGMTDMAVYRPDGDGSGVGRWYVINSSNSSFNTFQFGVNGDVPLPQDYDGDGRADLAVFRPADSNWYMVKSTNNLFYVYPFGIAGDKPVPADYTGDGKAEIAVWRPADGSWHTVDLTNGAYSTFNWGVTGDVPVPGDYSGDGRADYSVYRPANNTWYRMNSNDFFMYDTRWGVAGDIPVPGDYDGDGSLDLAVFRPVEGRWYVLTASFAFMTQQFGINGDKPTESAYVYGLTPGVPF